MLISLYIIHYMVLFLPSFVASGSHHQLIVCYHLSTTRIKFQNFLSFFLHCVPFFTFCFAYITIQPSVIVDTTHRARLIVQWPVLLGLLLLFASCETPSQVGMGAVATTWGSRKSDEQKIVIVETRTAWNTEWWAINKNFQLFSVTICNSSKKYL